MLALSSFDYEPENRWYKTSLRFDGVPIEIYVSDAETKDTAVLNDRLARAVKWMADNLDEVLAYCAAELLDVKNQSWVNSPDEQVTADEFKKQLRLESLRIGGDGSLELTFLGGDLFWGHWVVVRTDPEHNLNYVDIEG